MAVRLSSVLSQGSTTDPINSFRSFNDTRDLFQDSNELTWLRTGTLLENIGDYPDATQVNVYNSNRELNVSGIGLVTFSNPFITGIQRQGNDIWVMVTNSSVTDVIMQKYDINFNLLREFSIKGVGKPLIGGQEYYYNEPTFAFDGTNHWVVFGSPIGFGNASPYVIDVNGALVAAYDLYGNTFPIEGCTFDGSKIWVCNGTGDSTGNASLKEINLNGTFSGNEININDNFYGGSLVWDTDKFVIAAIDGINNTVTKTGVFGVWDYQGFVPRNNLYFSAGNDFYVTHSGSTIQLFFPTETTVVGNINKLSQFEGGSQSNNVFTRIL